MADPAFAHEDEYFSYALSLVKQAGEVSYLIRLNLIISSFSAGQLCILSTENIECGD
jgi:hypothetical protein